METRQIIHPRSLEPAAGVVGAYQGGSSTPKILTVVFAGLTVCNALELLVLIFATFQARKGLYFWSLLVSSIGLIPYAVGFSVKLLGIWTGNAAWTGVVLLTIGWYAMVTGQSVVLWSRLHLIVSGEGGRKILLYTKWMICVNAVVLHISTSVVTFGSNGSLSTHGFIKAYNVIEKIQMTGFCLQEFIISIIYIRETASVLRTSLRPRTKSIMQQLIYINVLIIVMDVALLGIEYASLFLLETILKGFIYSIKLKFEFAILSRLVSAVGGREYRSQSFVLATLPDNPPDLPQDPDGISEFVDMTKISTDYRHAANNDHICKRQLSRLDSEPEIQHAENVLS